MPVYSDILSNEKIIRVLQGKYKIVAIIGCGACTNESLAYKNFLPIFDTNKNGYIYPYATAAELLRLESFLKGEGYQVEIKYFNDIDGFVCMRKINGENPYPIIWNSEPDIILSLCCGSGCDVISEMFPHTPIVKITQQVGTLFYSYADENGKRMISRDQSVVVPLNLD